MRQMSWIAQHKGLALSIALVVGSVALAPAMAGADVMGDVMGSLSSGNAAANVAGKAQGHVDDVTSNVDVPALPGVDVPDGSVAGNVAGNVQSGAAGAVGNLGLTGAAPSVDDARVHSVATGSATVADTTANGRTAAEVTGEKAQANTNLGATGEHGSGAAQGGVGVSRDGDANANLGSDVASDNVGGAVDATGSLSGP